MNRNNTTYPAKEDPAFTLSKFSHEIRNPISLVCSEIQHIACTHPEITGYDGWARIIDNLNYTRMLLNEFSVYNNAGKICPESTNLTDYLLNVLACAKPAIRYLDITLETNIPANLPYMPIDRIKMRQALLNLLRNAQEAVPSPGGRITVSADRTAFGVRIRIEDNGCGVPDEIKAKIFTPFFTAKQGGTGIGLAVAKQVIEAHGGKIEVTDAPTQGSAFCITLA